MAQAAAAFGWKGRSMSREPYLMVQPPTNATSSSLPRNSASCVGRGGGEDAWIHKAQLLWDHRQSPRCEGRASA